MAGGLSLVSGFWVGVEVHVVGLGGQPDGAVKIVPCCGEFVVCRADGGGEDVYNVGADLVGYGVGQLGPGGVQLWGWAWGLRGGVVIQGGQGMCCHGGRLCGVNLVGFGEVAVAGVLCYWPEFN